MSRTIDQMLDPGQIAQETFDPTNSAVKVNIVTGSASFVVDSEIVDDAAFTPGTSSVMMIGATLDDTGPDSVNEGDGGALRMSANRNLYSQIRDAAGNERGVNVTAGNALTVDGSAVTQPVSAASLPLPTGAATEATLSTLNGKVTAVNTGAVVVASSALPTGAATAALQTQPGVDIGDVTINNAAGVSAVNIQDGGNSITVDGSVTTTEAAYSNVEFVRNAYGSTSVTTAAYVELIASTAAAYKEIHIADTSGQTLKLAIGAAASEVDKIIIPPGGTFPMKFAISAGSRVSIRAISGTASSGEVCIQLLG